jgi:16S rRNA (uracil1498-N3)-methyltransferase
MSSYDFRIPRLYVDAPLAPAATVPLNRDQTNHLVNVLRLKSGDCVLVFNGRDGEWRANLAALGKRGFALAVVARTRAQTHLLDLHYLFAPLKHARLGYMTQKAVEMGVSRLQPVMTRHAQIPRVNLDRMRANVIEAAQQCGILKLPEVAPPVTFERMLAAREATRVLVFCDEDAPLKDPIAALSAIRSSKRTAPAALAVLVGPEGGFATDERVALSEQPNVVRISLGPRILRADTAAVAALALVEAVLGDWQ